MKEGFVNNQDVAHAMALEENKGRNQHVRNRYEKIKSKVIDMVYGNEELKKAQLSSEKIGVELENRIKERERVLKEAENKFKAAGINAQFLYLSDGQRDPYAGSLSIHYWDDYTAVWAIINNSLVTKETKYKDVDLVYFKIDIDRKGEEISLKFKENPEKNRYFSFAEKDLAIEQACDFIKSFRLRPQDVYHRG